MEHDAARRPRCRGDQGREPATGGDNARHAQPRYETAQGSESVYFCNVNRNKRSVALDLKHPAGVQALRDLAREADVVVENFRPGVADRLGIGYEALRAVRPTIIYCALSGYGQGGPLAGMAGHDLNIAGMSGLLQRSSDEAPAMPTMLMGDYAGAVMVVIGILSAIVDRERHGRGAFLDVAMLDALVSFTSISMTGPFARRVDPAHAGVLEGFGGNPRYAIYRTRDGRYVTASLLEKKYWDAFCTLVGREDLINPDETEADRLSAHGARGPLYRGVPRVAVRDPRPRRLGGGVAGGRNPGVRGADARRGGEHAAGRRARPFLRHAAHPRSDATCRRSAFPST